MLVTLAVPQGVYEQIAWRRLRFGVSDDGTLVVPLFAAKELIAAGCTLKEPSKLPAFDLRDELQKAPPQDIHTFLGSRGIDPIPGDDADNMQRALWIADREQGP